MADLELSAEERRTLGEAALDWVLTYFANAAVPPLYPSIGASELQATVAEPLPKEPQDPRRVLEQFATLAACARNNGHPRMFGYVQSSGNFAATIGDFLASALNQNVTSWRSAPSATTLELQVVDWLKEFVGFESGAAGLLLGGGSAANAAALFAALRASTDIDVVRVGVAALPGPPRIYASDRVHMSIAKAAALMGLGRDAVRIIPSTDEGRMDVAALSRALSEDRSAGLHQICVVANAGEVNAGAIDPLDSIADLCAHHRLWLHVDGAYGGFAAAVPRIKPSFAGIARADSLSLDPHKWLFTPLDAGCLLVRDERHLRAAFSHGAAYIDVVADRQMSEFAFWDVSPELSRRFRALKIWFALKCHGAHAFVETIERNIELADSLGRLVDASADFERLAPVSLSIVCFRYLPPDLHGDEALLNAFTRELMIELQRGGHSYVSNAMLGSTFALRACIVNHRTTQDDVKHLLDDIRAAAARLRQK
jgi:glutamate/tyrosine decarboxylase-like PLP-dependent enzyme